MKKIISTFLVSFCVLLPSTADEKRPTADSVELNVAKAVVPVAKDKRRPFLKLAPYADKKQEARFSVYPTDDWKRNFDIFAGTLVKKAVDMKLNSKSLRKVLDKAIKTSGKDLAYLPIGGYQATLDGRLVWILRMRWGVIGFDDDLSHIRSYAYDQQSLVQVGFYTCN